jgi:pimeloyl-ACP methyl ester carboxylesterase
VPEPFFIVAANHRLEVLRYGGRDDGALTLVLLHEGLGCITTWRDFPADLAEATGMQVVAYSRWGYGQSDPVVPPRPLRYMHDEALDALPEVLDQCGVRRAVLVGHSDGGSIALIHAAAARGRERVEGLALLAPHVFCEPLSVASIEEARTAFLETDLRERLARHHRDVDGAFWGWNRAWLDPDFMQWNIEEYLPNVRVPLTVVQGADDRYGTLAQVDSIVRQVSGPVRRVVLEGVGHALHREAPDATLEAVVDLVQRLSD